MSVIFSVSDAFFEECKEFGVNIKVPTNSVDVWNSLARNISADSVHSGDVSLSFVTFLRTANTNEVACSPGGMWYHVSHYFSNEHKNALLSDLMLLAAKEWVTTCIKPSSIADTIPRSTVYPVSLVNYLSKNITAFMSVVFDCDLSEHLNNGYFLRHLDDWTEVEGWGQLVKSQIKRTGG